MDVAAYLAALRAEVDAALARVLVQPHAPAIIADAMRYPLAGGGKRLRPCLTLAVAEASGAHLDLDLAHSRALALPGACAVELIHTYSLVHDDLPAMDNDDLRRGRATTHVVYGDGAAILVGDGLLTEAFSALAASPSPANLPDAPEASAGQRLRAVATLAHAAGAAGMVGGQAVDLVNEGQVKGATARLDGAGLEDMHRRKTGALIRAACALGAILTGAADAALAAVDDYARDLGLAFQIIDDVLDVEGSKEALGKTAGKDAAAGKLTYVSLYGIDGSRRRAAECTDRAIAALAAAQLGGRLADIARWSLARQN